MLGFVSEEKNDGIKYFLIFLFVVFYFFPQKTNKVFFIWFFFLSLISYRPYN